MRACKTIGYTLLLVLTMLSAGAQNKHTYNPDSTFADLSLDKAGDNSVLRPGEDPLAKITGNIFIRGKLSKQTCYVGEHVQLTYRLYSALQNTSQVSVLPVASGCDITEDSISNEQVKRQTIEGKEYRVFILWRATLSTLQDGTVTISPLTADNRIHYLNNDGTRTEYAGPVQSDPIDLRVIPLPSAGRPAGFSGLIGNYRLHVTAPASLTAGKAGNLRMEITGTGNLAFTGVPTVRWPAGVDTFAPHQTVQVTGSGFPARGGTIIDISFVPRSPGRFALPPIALFYFDPFAASYKTVLSDSIVMDVQPGVAVVARPVVTPVPPRFPYIWIAEAMALLGLGLGTWVYLRTRRSGEAPVLPVEAPVDVAVAAGDPTGPAPDPLRESFERLIAEEDPSVFYPELKQWLSICPTELPDEAVGRDLSFLRDTCEEYLYSPVGTFQTLPALKARTRAVMDKLVTYTE